MSGSEDDEGTPMVGPLPLELQQIQADSQREAAAAQAAQVRTNHSSVFCHNTYC